MLPFVLNYLSDVRPNESVIMLDENCNVQSVWQL